MAKDETASKRLAEVTARARARYTINLQRAFRDLLLKLEHVWPHQPIEQHKIDQDVVALKAVADFLNQMGPYTARFADQFIKLARTLQDERDGIRRTPTRIQLGRAHVALAVEILRGPDGNRTSRKSAAKWAAKRHPGLKQLIIEKPPHRSDEERHRSDNIETAIISWCEDFHSDKVENDYAKGVYAVGLSKLKAWAPNCNDAQLEDEADRLLQEALRFCSDTV